MSICVISQPRFFPGLHYLHRMMVADVFVIFDTARFNPGHEENRTKLKSPQGSRWLTVPVRTLRFEQPIRDTGSVSTVPWQRKAIATITSLYGKAPSFKTYAKEIIDILERPHETLTQLDRASWEPALRLLGVTCRFVYSSELPVSGKGWCLLLEMCKYLGVDTYLSGAFGRDYLNVAEFAAQGVEVRFHDYSYPVHPQRWGDFVPFLSYLDMLFNVGLDRNRVLSGGKMLPPD